jgi:hypothetical protein
MLVNTKDTNFTGAFHVGRAPMTLLGTAGLSKEAPAVMRRRSCAGGHAPPHVHVQRSGLVRWVGELRQPDIQRIHRSNLIAVEAHKKLSVSPRSTCTVATKLLPLKLLQNLVVCAETKRT